MKKTTNLHPIFLILSICILTTSCRKRKEIKDKESIKEKVEYITTGFKIDTALAQNQYYKVKEIGSELEIWERGIFLSNKDIIAKARIKLKDNNYEEVEINFDNGSIKSDVLVKYENDRYISYLNGVKKDSIVITKNDALFEGPNPTFDFINSRKVLKNTSSKTSDVIGINWVSGGLSLKKQEFKNHNDTILINKPSTKRLAKFYNDMQLSVRIHRYFYDYYLQNKESYHFKKEYTIPKYFK